MSRRNLVFANRERIRELAASRNASTIALFGSTARGDDTEESDCDFVAEFNPGTTLFDLAGLQLDLEDLLGCPVDVVSRRSVPTGATSVARDAIVV